jgi:hypothetical protein
LELLREPTKTFKVLFNNCYKTVVKYKILKIFPRSVKGGSTGFLPTNVRIIKTEENDQYLAFLIGENFLLEFDILFNGKISKTATDIIRAITPPTFDGIERKIA